jgi:hypothetical protein
MRTSLIAGAAVGAVLLAGCAAPGAGEPARRTAAAATVTVTSTVTETVTSAPLGDPAAGATDSPQLTLEVYTDGCGVIRSEPAVGVSYDNLTWSVRDAGGFEVLGRNAEGETRYRYFQAGDYTVVLQAWLDGAYRAVSNEVTVHC